MSPRRTTSAWRERFAASAWAKPAGRVALFAAGLVLLAAIGRASAGPPGATPRDPAVLPPALTASSAAPADAGVAPPAPPSPSPAGPATQAPPADAAGPVVLNEADEDGLRTLPGIGPKRAQAILALRARIGRFHRVEDLLRVKGIGRATLKRLRPLVRVDRAPP